MDDQTEEGLTCIDSEVGERILELRSTALDDHERMLLEAHAEACDSCRLTLDLERRLAEGIRNRTLSTSRTTNHRALWLGWSSAAAIAASLVLLMAAPPRPVGHSFVQRGEGSTRFVQPVEGEVVKPGELMIAWTKVAGAESYGISIAGTDDDSTWNGSTSDTHILVPANARLPRNKNLRVLLTTRPEDLLPPGSVSITYRTGSAFAATSHRARHAQPLVYVLWLSGLGLGLACVMVRRT